MRGFTKVNATSNDLLGLPTKPSDSLLFLPLGYLSLCHALLTR